MVGSCRCQIKGINKRLILYFFLFVFTGLIGSAAHQRVRIPIVLSLADEFWVQCDTLSIAEGDIILRRGNAFASTIIARFFGKSEGMSHCGIILQQGGQWQVIHTISGMISDDDGIRITPLKEFIAEAEAGRIAVKRYRLGYDPDLLRLHVLRFLERKIPFDHSFDLGDKSRFYCTELIRDAFVAAGSADFFHYGRFAGRPVLEFSTFFDPDLYNPVIQTY